MSMAASFHVQTFLMFSPQENLNCPFGYVYRCLEAKTVHCLYNILFFRIDLTILVKLSVILSRSGLVFSGKNYQLPPYTNNSSIAQNHTNNRPQNSRPNWIIVNLPATISSLVLLHGLYPVPQAVRVGRHAVASVERRRWVGYWPKFTWQGWRVQLGLVTFLLKELWTPFCLGNSSTPWLARWICRTRALFQVFVDWPCICLAMNQPKFHVILYAGMYMYRRSS